MLFFTSRKRYTNNPFAGVSRRSHLQGVPMFHTRFALCVGLGLGILCLCSPSQAHCQTARAAIERQYSRLDSALARNDVSAILAIQSPAFTSFDPNGTGMDYRAMESRTRLLSSLVDSVIYAHNTIRDFAEQG